MTESIWILLPLVFSCYLQDFVAQAQCGPFLQTKLYETLDRIEAAPGVQINTGATAAGSGTALPFLPTLARDGDDEATRFPDSRVRDEELLVRAHRAELYDGEGDVDAVEEADSKRPRLWKPDMEADASATPEAGPGEPHA
jgi:hypothetical protein